MIDEKVLIERLEEEAEEHKKYWQEFGDEDSFGGMNATMRAIEIVNQLAEESNNGWIPCSERLPEECVPVLVCNIEGKVYIRQINWISRGRAQIPYWSQNSTGIIAWQPLPTPFKPKE